MMVNAISGDFGHADEVCVAQLERGKVFLRLDRRTVRACAVGNGRILGMVDNHEIAVYLLNRRFQIPFCAAHRKGKPKQK